MSQESKKLLAKLEQVNEKLGTNYEISLELVPFTPQNPLPIISQGDVYLKNKRLFSYRKLQRRSKSNVFGMTRGPYFIAILYGKTVLQLNISKIHRRWDFMCLRYKFTGSNENVTYGKKEIRQLLNSLA